MQEWGGWDGLQDLGKEPAFILQLGDPLRVFNMGGPCLIYVYKGHSPNVGWTGERSVELGTNEKGYCSGIILVSDVGAGKVSISSGHIWSRP